jgi:predicted ABC-type sugar transport system permease subunit
VESRVVNLWAMVLSGIVVLMAVVVPLSRRRRHGI